MKLKKKEEAVAKALKEAGIGFQREHVVLMSCADNKENKFIRVDFLIVDHGYVFALEVDETQHEDYIISCESLRPFKIAESLALGGNSMPIVVIRFNPDAFKVGGVITTVTMEDRYTKLIDTIRYWNKKQLLAVHYMYYDLDSNGELTIAKHEEFRKETLTIVV